jgi:alpha-glucosidase
MKRDLFYSILSLLALLGCRTSQDRSWTLSNQNRNLRFTIIQNDSGLTYQVNASRYGTRVPIIESSPLGIVRTDQDFSAGLSFVSKSGVKVIDEKYCMKTGKAVHIRNKALEQTFTFQNPEKARIEIIVRAYADGMAFRYRFPEISSNTYTVTHECTGFNMPDSGRAWMLPYSKVDTWAPAYEAEWQNAIRIGTLAPDSIGWCFPALFHTNGRWIMITEADMDTSYFGAHLDQPEPGGLYTIRMPEADETYGAAPREPSSPLPWQTPWRTLIIGANPRVILKSNLVNNLSAPCVLEDTSWIKPGRVSWSWWSDMDSPYRYSRLVPFIDLSARMGWEYSLIDLGWQKMSDGGDIQKLLSYAKSKGVGLILWYNSGGPHNQVPDACPCDIMNDPERRRAEMAKLESWGVKGIKVDFMQSDKQYVMKLYQDILKDAVEFHLMVNFHGATVPRGWARTYPNLMTMEGIRGGEQYWDVNFAENAHKFHTIYTFTRNVTGSMDYTPVIFGDAPQKIPHQTTNAHELATSVMFESGWQHFIDTPASYLSQPRTVVNFLKKVPVVWDEIRYIKGRPGELSILARRHGKDWYLAGLNGEVRAKTVSIPLLFLRDDEYVGDLISDGENPRSFKITFLRVYKKTVLSVDMAERGGFVVRLQLVTE